MPNREINTSDIMTVMLEEYKSLQEEIRLADNLYMQAFIFGFTGIAAIIGVFISSNNFIMQASATTFIMPLVCIILSYYLFLHQEHGRYTIINSYISQYRMDSLINKDITVFSRVIMKDSHIAKSINSRQFLSISPIIIMHMYQGFSVLIHIYVIVIHDVPAYVPNLIEGLTPSQYILVCVLEIFIPFLHLIFWNAITRKMRRNIKNMKSLRQMYFSNLKNVRAKF